MTKRLKYSLISFLTIVLAIISFAWLNSNTARAVEHSNCSLSADYCLVCDVAEKINALPNESDITIDNAAAVMQQINDIDRIKYNLSDAQFYDELIYMVDHHDNGVDHNVITKYDNAVKKVRDLTGVNFAISKSFDLNGESVSDTSDAQVSFEITNLDNSSTTVLSLFDLDLSTSAFAYDCYEMTSDGWMFIYKLPVGNYRIKEINTDKPITVNGEQSLFHCSEININGVTESGLDAIDGMEFSLTSDTYAGFSNTKCSYSNAVADEDANTISGICDSCNETYTYQLLAPSGELVSDGTTLFNTAIVEKTCMNNFHFGTSDQDFGGPYVEYLYKETASDTYATTTDYTQAGFYKATLYLQIEYSNTLEVSVEYEVTSPAPPNAGGEGGSIVQPEPSPDDSTEIISPDAPESAPEQKDIKSIIEENKLVIATTGFAVFSIIIVFGMTMSFKKKD